MASGSNTIVKKFELQGSFDIKNILSEINKITSAFSNIKMNNTESKQFNTTIENMKRKAEDIQAAINRGFSSPAELKKFMSDVRVFEQDLSKVGIKISNLNIDFSKLNLPPDTMI